MTEAEKDRRIAEMEAIIQAARRAALRDARRERDDAIRALAEERIRYFAPGSNWEPCGVHGYEQRINEDGRLEMRAIDAVGKNL